MKKPVMLLLIALIAGGFIASAQEGSWLAPSPDFAFLVAHLPQSGTPRWAINGRAVPSFQPTGRLVLPADGTLAGTDGIQPSNKPPVIFEVGKWGSAFRLASGEMVAYPRKGLLDLAEGGVEFWLSPHEDGIRSGLVPPTRLFAYESPKGDFITIQVSDQGVIHGGAIVAKAWESAYSDQASVRGWKSGTWHHVLLTWSASASRMRLYLDGRLMGDTNEGRYLPPDPSGSSFLLGSPYYAIDSVRIWNGFIDGSIAANAVGMSSPPTSRESLLALAGLAPGDIITCEAAGKTARYSYRGPPIANPQPRSGLLPSGTTTFDLSLESSDETTLRYSVGTLLDFASMTPAKNETAGRRHRLAIKGVSTDPSVSTDVYVRAASFPGYVLHLRYRDLPLPPSTFPRIANLWYDGSLDGDPGANLAKLGLLVPSLQSPGEATLRRLHRENPNLLILATSQSFEHFNHEPDVPESWYLRDADGQCICMWPNSFRLNVTIPEVVEYNARRIQKILVDSDYFFDGAFFDSFSADFGAQRDSYGRTFTVDADNDGKPDDPAAFASAWRAGVMGIAARFKELEPVAIMTGHLGEEARLDFLPYFHGDNIAFRTVDVTEGLHPFASLRERYDSWWAAGRKPGVTVIDAGAPNQLGYGYGVYGSWEETRRGIPEGVLDFARTWYPTMRFGLTTTLMNDGYFERHFSDVLYCLDWWYDEFDAKLGKALGPSRLAFESTGSKQLAANGDFEGKGVTPWVLSAHTAVGASATIALEDAGAGGSGSKSLLVRIAAKGNGESYRINLYQGDISLTSGSSYEISFRARADAPRTVDVTVQRRSGEWENLGFAREVSLDREWKDYSFRFEATGSRTDAGLQFFLGADSSAVRLDDISMREVAPEVWRRDFEHGMALVNGTAQPQTLTLPAGYSRLKGDQAPRWQYIIDDGSSNLTLSGRWSEASHDTPAWKVDGPFYHNWGKTSRESSEKGATAEWNLGIPEDGTYTIKAWWTAAPDQADWTRSAIYEVVVRGKVVSSHTLDQSVGGDEWITVGTARLKKGDRPFLRLRNGGTGVLYADAVLVESEARYNDGSAVRELTLAPFDGIVLMKNR
ncbi:MAG: hypothetical protein E4H20_07875 [Spirochaetales bacterium]|nr:MAG: hypothetical protein E4H20_07875 [Spirochaetales bacterium]